MNKIFIDSNYFIALYNPQDTLHSKAILLSQIVKGDNLLPVISNYIFLESLTVLSQRMGRKVAIDLGEELLSGSPIQIVHIDERLHELTWKIFQDVRKKNVSFVDCSTLAVMKAEGIKKLLTFDYEDFASLRKGYRFGIL